MGGRYSDMAKPIEPIEMEIGKNPSETDISMDVEIEDDDLLLDDGLEILIGEQVDQVEDEFEGNLLDVMSDDSAMKISIELCEFYDADKRSRSEWERGVVKGLDLLGFKVEERSEPWPGACGVYHPVLAETATQFQAHAIMELFPASGPARTTIFGKEDDRIRKVAKRVEQELNFQITQKMTEYRSETEQLLYRLAMVGSAFKKVYYDPAYQRPFSMYVPAEDFVVPYGASDLGTCERYTHCMKRTTNQLKKLMRKGFYKTCELDLPTPTFNDVKSKLDKIAGEQPSMEVHDKHTVLEVHADLDLSDYGFKDRFTEEGEICPYVVTIEYHSQKALAIRRNWDETDSLKKKRVHFVHYQYLPGLGFYGTGLFHLIGGLAKSATSVLRQLIDNGTISNLPSGFKARGMRIKSDDSPMRPGEFKDVDVPGNSIRDGILLIPTKEASPTQFSLLTNLVDEARRLGSVPDMDITDLQEGLPVGTTLAVLERSLKVMSAVQARLHAALRVELGLIADIVAAMPGEYEYGVEGEYSRAEDFGDRVSIVPVSDPNAATSAQRIIQYQTVLQLAQQSPMLYDMPQLHRNMLEYIGVKDAAKLVKLQDDFQPMDPVGENMAILTSKPVRAFQFQDHESHIAVHMAAAQDPAITGLVQQAPNAQAIMGAMSAHILEHVAMAYRQSMEDMLGAQLPGSGDEVPPDVEVKLSGLVAQAAQKLLGRNKAMEAQKAAEAAAQDPLVQIQLQELELKKAELELRSKDIMAKHAISGAKLSVDDENTKLKVAADLAKSAETKHSGLATKAADMVVDMAKTVHQSEELAKKTAMDHQRGAQSEGLKAQLQREAMEKKNEQ